MNALKQWDNCSRKSKRLSKSFRASISAASKSSTDGRYIEESLLSDTSQKPEVDSKELTLSEALKEIKRLKKALDLEKIRSAGYSHMIELAEQQFNIPIRKKSGTKQ